MLSFFQTIFQKITTAVASIAVAIGLVSAPLPPESIVEEQPQVIVETREEPASQKSAELEVEKLKKEIEELKKAAATTPQLQPKPQPQTQPKPSSAPAPTQPPSQSQPKIITLPNGAIAEVDVSGNVIRIIQSAPVITSTPQPTPVIQRQQEQERINSINNQISAILDEYENKKAAIDRQILEIKQQYYKDVENEESRAASMPFLEGAIRRLTNDANLKIDKLNLEKESLRLEYLEKVRNLERQL